ncbi:MAG: glutathione S-transferase [Chthoniobacteraceae bacterium]
MSVVLYHLPHSPYAIPVRQALIACSVSFEEREVPNADRSAIIRLTGGAYYQVPLLIHDGRAIYESTADSLDVARYVDSTWGRGRLFPEQSAAANLCLTEWLEDAVEARTFKLADIHWIPAIEDIVDRTMNIRHKERRFGRGCLDQWTRDAASIRADLDRLIARCEHTLRHTPFLLGPAPVYADFALFGVLGNLCHHGWNHLSAEQNALRDFVGRLGAWRY